MKPQNWNDILALLLLFLIPTLWVLYGRGMVDLNESVSGALIVTWTMVIQYYFRRQPPKNGE